MRPEEMWIFLVANPGKVWVWSEMIKEKNKTRHNTSQMMRVRADLTANWVVVLLLENCMQTNKQTNTGHLYGGLQCVFRPSKLTSNCAYKSTSALGAIRAQENGSKDNDSLKPESWVMASEMSAFSRTGLYWSIAWVDTQYCVLYSMAF